MFGSVLSGFSSLLQSILAGDKEIPNSDMNREKDEQYYLAWEGEKVNESDYEEISEFRNRYGYLHTHAAGDMQHFRDKLKGEPNVRFYQNRIPSEPDGVYIDEFHNSWFGDYRRLEHVHSYIQWLFPIQEKGMNYSSYPLSHEEIQIFHNDEELQKKLLKSYKLMLDFYGIKLLEPQEPQEPQKQQEPQKLQEQQKLQEPQIGEVCRADNWKERSDNLNRNTHNNLRITRILKCLGILGLSQYQAPLVKFFLQETLVNKTLSRVKQSVLDYFIFAVLDEDKRNELIRFAFQHFEPKEQFMWCPKNSKIFRKKKSKEQDHSENNSQTTAKIGTKPQLTHESNVEESDLGEDAKDQESGSKADKNVFTEAGTNEANSAKAENSLQSENSDGSVPKNQTNDTGTNTNTNKYSEDSNKASELDTNKESAKDQKSGSEARDENVTTKAGTQEDSELPCTRAKKHQVPSEKTTAGSTCENPTENTDTNSNKAMKNANGKIQDNDKAEDDVTANARTNAAQEPDSVHQTESTKQADVPCDKTSDDPTSEIPDQTKIKENQPNNNLTNETFRSGSETENENRSREHQDHMKQDDK